MYGPNQRSHGRPSGATNKSTKAAKQMIEAVHEGIGGYEAMLAWAKDEPTEFYKLWAKLIPVSLKADIELDSRREVATAELAGMTDIEVSRIYKDFMSGRAVLMPNGINNGADG